MITYNKNVNWHWQFYTKKLINKMFKICLEIIKNEYCEWILMKQKYNFDLYFKMVLIFVLIYIFYYLSFIINNIINNNNNNIIM